VIVTDKFRNCAGKCFFSLIFISTLLTTGGCQQTKPGDTQTMSEPEATYTAPAITPGSSMPESKMTSSQSTASAEGSASTCQRELVALSKINQRLYAQKKAAFNELISSASVYTAVRDDITAQTKDTMDAFYKFKTQKICSDIEQTVRQALISRVDGSQ
jgi:hypothetical protein